jgi:hypothetical protein
MVCVVNSRIARIASVSCLCETALEHIEPALGMAFIMLATLLLAMMNTVTTRYIVL